MKKVLLIPEFSSFGGTRNHFIRLLEFYANQKYDFVIVISKKQYDKRIKLLIKQYGCKHYIIRERRKGRLQFLDFFPFNVLSDIRTILPIYLREKPNLIAVSNGTPGMFIGLILFPASFVYTFHTSPLKSKCVGLTTLQKLFLGLCMKSNKILLVVSNYSKKQLLTFWVPEKKSKFIHVVHNSARKPMLGKNMNHNENIYRILTTGHVEWYKNPKLWIEVSQKVIKQRLNAHLEFIWIGDGNLLDECRSLVSQTKLKNIKFIGYRKDVDSMYDRSTIYFQPSLLESHGISVVEAMMHGLPCVTSDAGGLPESVVNGETGFVCPPDDVKCFVSQIIKLLKNDNLRYKMGQNGKLQAETLFSEESQNEKMVKLYTSLLKE